MIDPDQGAKWQNDKRTKYWLIIKVMFHMLVMKCVYWLVGHFKELIKDDKRWPFKLFPWRNRTSVESEDNFCAHYFWIWKKIFLPGYRGWRNSVNLRISEARVISFVATTLKEDLTKTTKTTKRMSRIFPWRNKNTELRKEIH